MVLSDDAKEALRYAWNYAISPHYIVLCTGKQAYICNRAMQVLGNIQNLKYVYNAYVSPDEKHLLLVSNENRFYLVSLEDCSVLLTHRIKKPYLGNLEGVACWGASSDTFYVPVQDDTNLLSTIRQYSFHPNFSYNDDLVKQYWIVYVSYVESEHRFLAIGLNRDDHKIRLIWWDENKNYTIYKLSDYDDAVINVELLPSEKLIVLIGSVYTYVCNYQGRPFIREKKLNCEVLQEVFSRASLHFSDVKCMSISPSDKNVLYIGTLESLLVVDLTQGAVRARFQVDFGIQSVTELCERIVIASTWSGVKVFEIPDRK